MTKRPLVVDAVELVAHRMTVLDGVPEVSDAHRAGVRSLQASLGTRDFAGNRNPPRWHRSDGPRSSSCLHDLPQGGGCLSVAAGDSVGVLSSVVETRRWSRRRETMTSGTPAWSISVAMKWRRSWSRNGRSPAARRWRRNALVTRFGFQAVAPPSSLNTNPSGRASVRERRRGPRRARRSSLGRGRRRGGVSSSSRRALVRRVLRPSRR